MGEGMGDADGWGSRYGVDWGHGTACGDGDDEGGEGLGAGYGHGDMSYRKNHGFGDADGQGGILGMGNG